VFLGAGPTFRVDPVSFWMWLLGVYLVTLAAETSLLARGTGDLTPNPLP